MKKFMIVNPEGLGKSANQKVKESAKYYDATYTITDGANAGYGSLEYLVIETDQTIDSDFMKSIAYNTKVSEIE